MNKDKLTNKENSEIINKLYPGNNISPKHNSKIKYGRTTKIIDDAESEKHIKEMHEFADKHEFKTNVVFLGLGIAIVSVILFFILLNTLFMKPKTDVAVSKTVTKNTVDSSPTKIDDIKPIKTENKIYEYLNVEANRTDLLKKAVDLNKGSQKGITIYLLSEILRLNTFDIPANTSSVEQLMKCLTSMDWKKNTDFTQLEKGDVCFTTDMPKKPGVPSHAYVFMGWVEDGKTDYAYVCDGQVEEYGNILHKRNISILTAQKDKFSFFLRK
jgi:hypothetical protein